MSKEALISVIVPIYNIKPYLTACVDSIIAQTYKNLEIILVDDESNDGCAEICDDYKRQDGRIVVLHKKNGGLSDARNAGMKLAKGKYLAFIDGDDYISPVMYEAMYAQVIAKNASLVTCKPTYEEGELCQNMDAKINLVDVCSGYDAIKYLYNDYICGNYAWNKFYKKELFDGIEFPYGKHFEDIPIMHEVFNRAKTAAILDEKLYFYRVREDQITNGDVVPFHTIKEHIEAFETRLNPNLPKVMKSKLIVLC